MLTCADCPKWANGWCGHLAKVMIGPARMCDIGRRLRKNELSKLYMRRRHGYKGRKYRPYRARKRGAEGAK